VVKLLLMGATHPAGQTPTGSPVLSATKVRLVNSAGKERASLAMVGEDAVLELDGSVNSITMFDKNRKVVWQALH
jgi:hypothetical protein